MNNLATVYQDTGKLHRGETLLRELLEQVCKQSGPESTGTATALSSLGLNLLKQKKYTEAEPLLRKCLVIRTEKLSDDWRTFNAQSSLGDALLGQKKYAEAEPLLVRGYEGMKRHEAKIPLQGKPRLPEALERLVWLYEAMDNKDKADSWRKKLEEAKKAAKGAAKN